jgi:hypothetical protein
MTLSLCNGSYFVSRHCSEFHVWNKSNPISKTFLYVQRTLTENNVEAQQPIVCTKEITIHLDLTHLSLCIIRGEGGRYGSTRSVLSSKKHLGDVIYIYNSSILQTFKTKNEILYKTNAFLSIFVYFYYHSSALSHAGFRTYKANGRNSAAHRTHRLSVPLEVPEHSKISINYLQKISESIIRGKIICLIQVYNICLIIQTLSLNLVPNSVGSGNSDSYYNLIR